MVYFVCFVSFSFHHHHLSALLSFSLFSSSLSVTIFLPYALPLSVFHQLFFSCHYPSSTQPRHMRPPASPIRASRHANGTGWRSRRRRNSFFIRRRLATASPLLIWADLLELGASCIQLENEPRRLLPSEPSPPLSSSKPTSIPITFATVQGYHWQASDISNA